MKQLLKELVETTGGPGKEEKIRNLITEKVEEHSDSIETDELGNLLVRKGSGDKTLMIAAHMDQVCANVRKIDEDGFIYVKKMWGMYPTELVNQKVKIEKADGEYVKGVIGMKPIHGRKEDEQREVPEMKDLVIEIGAESDEEVEDIGVEVGDYIYIDEEFGTLEKDYVTGPALDDRIGCAILVEAVKQFEEDYELVAVFTSQEEVGSKGAMTSTFEIDPDAGLAIDVSGTSGTPKLEVEKYEGELGEGPNIELIQMWGRGMIAPESIKEWLVGTAEEKNIDYKKRLGGGNDARKIETSRSGVPTGSIGIPTRHMHSPVEVAKMSDIKSGRNLVIESFNKFEEYF